MTKIGPLMALLAVVLAVVSAVASTALALPDISVSLGAAYPVDAHFHNPTITGKITNPVESISGKGVTYLVLLKELSSLGHFSLDIEHVENAKGETCNTPGDAVGIVLTEGDFHIVYTSLSPLTLGVLGLLVASTAECGALKIKGKGSILGSLKLGASESEELTSLSGELTGNGAGKPTLSTYYNDAGEAVKAKFELNFGTGFKEAAVEVEGVIEGSAEEGKMVLITNR
jgi:hypothetical protein